MTSFDSKVLLGSQKMRTHGTSSELTDVISILWRKPREEPLEWRLLKTSKAKKLSSQYEKAGSFPGFRAGSL